MIKKLYWTFRLTGYIACLGGIFFYLQHQGDTSPDLKNVALGIVGIGFLSFFTSYALRAWLRFGPRRNPDEMPPAI